MADKDCPLCRGTGEYINRMDKVVVCSCPFDKRELPEKFRDRLFSLAERLGWHSR